MKTIDIVTALLFLPLCISLMLGGLIIVADTFYPNAEMKYAEICFAFCSGVVVPIGWICCFVLGYFLNL